MVKRRIEFKNYYIFFILVSCLSVDFAVCERVSAFIYLFINVHIETCDELVYLSIHSHSFIFFFSFFFLFFFFFFFLIKVLFIFNIRRVIKLKSKTKFP